MFAQVATKENGVHRWGLGVTREGVTGSAAEKPSSLVPTAKSQPTTAPFRSLLVQRQA
jgi:hypothetical protein